MTTEKTPSKQAYAAFDAAHVDHVNTDGGDYPGYCDDPDLCPLRDAMAAAFDAFAATWRPLDTCDVEDRVRVDLWFNVRASPRSMGLADAWRVTDAWRQDGKWFDEDGELEARYITHWMPLPGVPA